jgi:hypothetical protein
LHDQCVDKRTDVLSRFFRNGFVQVGHLDKEFVYGALPVEQLPKADAGGVQAEAGKTELGIGIEKNGPVVKLLPEDDAWIGEGPVVFLHNRVSISSVVISR